jgi:pantetheine-phosphate adenylyltransferase
MKCSKCNKSFKSKSGKSIHEKYCKGSGTNYYGECMSTAIYAGSFDPFTFGHLSVATNASRLFDNVIILVANNENKDTMFSLEERVDIINDIIRSFGKLSVDSSDGYVVAYANENDIRFMVRGIRNKTDAKFEMQLAELNSALSPDVQTIFIPANISLSKVSSTGLKQRFSKGGDVSRYCPPEVIRAMRNKIK